MQVSISEMGPLERRLTVEVPEEQIHGEVQNRLKSLSRNVRIDGFRPGKAPMQLVQRRYSGQVRQEVVGEILRQSFTEAVNKEKLRPAGRPVFDPVRSEPGQGLSYTATFEVYPEIALAPIEDIKITKPICEVGEPDIDKMIVTLRHQRRSWKPVDRPAATGDQVIVDYKGTLDGKDYEGSTAENFAMELGAGRYLPDMEDGLIGKGVGEHQFSVNFPADYHRQELAGKTVQFTVTIKEVSEPELPEIDDEFFKAFGVHQGGLESFRVEVRRNMERERDNAVRNLTKEAVLEALLSANTVQLPKALVENEAERLLHEMQHTLREQGAPSDRIDAMQAEAFQPQAQRRISLGLMMGDIITRNGIKVDAARVRAAVDAVAASYDNPAAVVKWYYEDAQRLADVEIAVLEDQAVEWILHRCTVEEKVTAFDDLLKPGQTA